VQHVPSTARMRGAQLFAQPISASISRLFLLQSSRQLCHIRSTIECCQAAGIGVAACCEMAKAQTVAHEYRKQAGVERCFTAAPGVKKCAKRTENCASTGCCEEACHTCYEKNIGGLVALESAHRAWMTRLENMGAGAAERPANKLCHYTIDRSFPDSSHVLFHGRTRADSCMQKRVEADMGLL